MKNRFKKGLVFCWRQLAFKGVRNTGMKAPLAATGTETLLQTLGVYVPDDFINRLRPAQRGSGRRYRFSDAQLWRIHLLALLSGGNSFNQVVRLLPEQRAWRQFAHLSRQERTPDVRMLHEFRQRLGVSGLRSVNAQLVRRLLFKWPKAFAPVGIIDATDLPAATADSEKKMVPAAGRRRAPLWVRVRSSPVTRAFSWAIRSIVCGCFGPGARRGFCWCRW